MKPKPNPQKPVVAPAQKEINTVPSKWTTSKRYKVIGSALLLTAFAIQMHQTKASAHETEQMQAAELDSRCHVKSLGYENLFYAEKAAIGQEDPTNLYGAAEERALGNIVMMVTSDLPTSAKTAYVRDIKRAAGAVHDLESFNAFMKALKDRQEQIGYSEVDDLINIGKKAQALWWTYIVLYTIGSCCVLRSQYLE